MSEKTLYASAARTATPAAVSFRCDRVKALRLVIDTTAVGVTPSVVVTVDGLDSLSGKYFNLLTSTAITAVSTRVLEVGPGLTASANLVANTYLPATVRVSMTHGNGVTITYSVAAHLVR